MNRTPHTCGKQKLISSYYCGFSHKSCFPLQTIFCQWSHVLLRICHVWSISVYVDTCKMIMILLRLFFDSYERDHISRMVSYPWDKRQNKKTKLNKIRSPDTKSSNSRTRSLTMLLLHPLSNVVPLQMSEEEMDTLLPARSVVRSQRWWTTLDRCAHIPSSDQRFTAGIHKIEFLKGIPSVFKVPAVYYDIGRTQLSTELLSTYKSCRHSRRVTLSHTCGWTCPCAEQLSLKICAFRSHPHSFIMFIKLKISAMRFTIAFGSASVPLDTSSVTKLISGRSCVKSFSIFTYFGNIVALLWFQLLVPSFLSCLFVWARVPLESLIVHHLFNVLDLCLKADSSLQLICRPIFVINESGPTTCDFSPDEFLNSLVFCTRSLDSPDHKKVGDVNTNEHIVIGMTRQVRNHHICMQSKYLHILPHYLLSH